MDIICHMQSDYTRGERKIVAGQRARCKLLCTDIHIASYDVSETLIDCLVYLQDLDRLQEAETSNPVIRTSRVSTRIRSIDTFRGYRFAVLRTIRHRSSNVEYCAKHRYRFQDRYTVDDIR